MSSEKTTPEAKEGETPAARQELIMPPLMFGGGNAMPMNFVQQQMLLQQQQQLHQMMQQRIAAAPTLPAPGVPVAAVAPIGAQISPTAANVTAVFEDTEGAEENAVAAAPVTTNQKKRSRTASGKKAPAKKKSDVVGKKGGGDSKFADAETDHPLNMVEQVKPTAAGWDRVTRRHNRPKEITPEERRRSKKSLRSKFNNLATAKMPTGDSDCPPEVRRAKDIDLEIQKKSELEVAGLMTESDCEVNTADEEGGDEEAADDEDSGTDTTNGTDSAKTNKVQKKAAPNNSTKSKSDHRVKKHGNGGAEMMEHFIEADKTQHKRDRRRQRRKDKKDRADGKLLLGVVAMAATACVGGDVQAMMSHCAKSSSSSGSNSSGSSEESASSIDSANGPPTIRHKKKVRRKARRKAKKKNRKRSEDSEW